MNNDYTVVLDACVLVSASLRDTLLRLAETPNLYLPKWSDDIIAETTHTLECKLGRAPSEAEYLVSELKKAFPEAWVTGYKALEAGLTNDPKDRHVLAAAILAHAQQTVTFNLKHFPEAALEPYGISARHPDQFLLNQFHLDGVLVTRNWANRPRPSNGLLSA